MARAGSWKLVTVPPCVFEPVPLLSFFLRLGNSETWKVETAITLPVLNVCTFPATRKAGAVVTVPMGGQHVLLAIRIEHKRRIQSEDWLARWLAIGGRAGGFVSPTLPPWMRQEAGLWKRGLADVSIDCFRHQ